jgi:endonuclease/exonuclease/phosphatase family metal-dependent hydrolase
MTVSTFKTILVSILLFFLSVGYAAGEDIKVATWNIEHLGTDGRGFGGGFGGGELPLRTDEQLAKIGKFIRDSLKADIVALQEIGLTFVDRGGQSRSTELDKITDAMGDEWKYYLPPKHKDHDDGSMYVGFLWNSKKINAIRLKPLFVPNLKLAGKSLFDRTPAIGYFEIIKGNKSKNDFLLVNVHLASGQHNDENHLIAMTLIEYRLNKALKAIRVTESDRIILGDFNDNPYAKNKSDNLIHTDALYHHMAFKKYTDFVTADFHSTRMDSNLKSIIDHILVTRSAKNHVRQSKKADIWLPENGPSSFPKWRETFSDHFPVSINIKIGSDDDADWKD